MFGKKKIEKPKRDRTGRNLEQYGLFNVPTDMNFGSNSFESEGGDSDLEAELSALAGGSDNKKPRRPPRKQVPTENLDAMVAESMKDIPSDGELSGDDDDPALLNELREIAGEDEEALPESASNESTNVASTGESTDLLKLLDERLKMYESAEKIAKDAGETSRARRFNRGMKTLKDLIKQAKAGKAVNNEEIPPEVSAAPRKPAENSEPDSKPSRPAPAIPSSPEPALPSPSNSEENETEVANVNLEVNTELVNMLQERQKQYKIAALKAKKSGDSATAISYIKIAKQFDAVIKAAQNGQPVDLSKMPNPPPNDTKPKIEQEKVQTHSDTPEIVVPEGGIPEETLIVASSVLEALEQRLEVYRKQEEAAKEQGNSGKARRMGRIVKQYEQAIKSHKSGKPVPIDELPTPPGYGPIPVEGGAVASKPAPTTPSPAPAAASGANRSVKPRTPPKGVPSTSQTTRITGNQMPNSRAEKQLKLLLAKQKEFKEAALSAKKQGEIEQAKEYLRTSKGFDPLIEAASCGLPVDLSTLPISPSAKNQLNEEYDLVMTDECTDNNNGDIDVLTRLENQLNKQLKMCLTTRDHHKALGDVAGTNRFERLALNVTKDLDVIRLAHRTPNAGIPKFHYEMKDFSIVKSFTELGDNDLELTIVRGISYTCANPKDIDTYVKFEFPFPQEEPYSDRTSVVKDTNSPDYNATFTIPIQRTARACQRVFKRHSLKLEVYSKGGFFRGDTLIGTATVKLQHLETQCELHESFDILEGRKKVGGKLEVRLRLRHPIVSQQVEQIHEKWLIIDN